MKRKIVAVSRLEGVTSHDAVHPPEPSDQCVQIPQTRVDLKIREVAFAYLDSELGDGQRDMDLKSQIDQALVAVSSKVPIEQLREILKMTVALYATQKIQSEDTLRAILDKFFESKGRNISEISGPEEKTAISSAQLITELTDRYGSRENAQIRTLLNKKLPIKDCYVALEIVEDSTKKDKKDETEKKDDAKAGHVRENPLNRYEDIRGNRRAITLEKLFDAHNGKPVKRVLIKGRAGIGKSTLCQKITHTWASEGHQLWGGKFKMVLRINLRDLNAVTDEDMTVAQLITKHCFKRKGRHADKGAVESEIKRYLAEFPDKVLFILDGYDEFLPRSEIREMVEEDILGVGQGAKYHCILTSRPLGDHLEMDLVVENVGFTYERITDYVKSFFMHSVADTAKKDAEVKKLSDGVIAFLEQEPGLKGAAQIPINVELICSLYKDAADGHTGPLQTPMTVTQLYMRMEEYLCRRYFEKHGKDVPESVRKHRSLKKMMEDREYQGMKRCLECVAMGLMRSKTLIADGVAIEGHADECGVEEENRFDRLNAVGFMKCEGDSGYGADNRYEFIHLTFQEYFAAGYLCRQLREGGDRGRQEFEQMVRQEKYNPRYEVVWRFVSGQLKGDRLKNFFALLHAEPIDRIGVQALAVRCQALSEVVGEGNDERVRDELDETYQITEELGRQLKRGIRKGFDGIVYTKGCYWQYLGIARYNRRIIRSVVEDIVGILTNSEEDTDSRSNAAWALCEIGRSDASVVEALVTVLKDATKGEYIRSSVAEALGKIGRSDPIVLKTLVAVLKDATVDKYARGYAAEALGKIRRSDASVVEALLEVLKDATVDKRIRSSVAETLGKIERSDASVVEALVTVLKDATVDEYVRSGAAYTLGEIGRSDASVVEALVTVLKDMTMGEGIRSRVAYVLGEMGSSDPRVLEALLEILKDATVDGRIRSSVAEALGKIRRSDPSVVEALVAVLKDATMGEDIRSSAAWALGKIGRSDASVVEALVTVLKDTTMDEDIRSSAAWALGKIGRSDASVVEALVTVLKDTTMGEDIRSSAAYTLGKIGRSDTSVVEALLEVLKDATEDKYIRSSAAWALGKIGRSDASVVEALVTVLKDTTEDKYARGYAAEALGRIGGGDPSVVEALLEVLKDATEDKYIRSSAARALGKIGSSDPRVLEALVAVLKDKTVHRCIRLSAAVVLSKIEGYDLRVLEALLEIIEGTFIMDRSECKSVAYALDRIALHDATSRLHDISYETLSRSCEKELTLGDLLQGTALLKLAKVVAESGYKDSNYSRTCLEVKAREIGAAVWIETHSGAAQLCVSTSNDIARFPIRSNAGVDE